MDNTLKYNFRFNESYTGDNIWMPSNSSREISSFDQFRPLNLLTNIEKNTQISILIDNQIELQKKEKQFFINENVKD